MEKLIETIKIVSSIFTLIIGAGTVFGTIIPSWRKKLKNIINPSEKKIEEIIEKLNHQSESDRLIREASLCSLRNSITQIYYRHFKEGQFTTYEKENLIKMYEAYEDLNGNSYVHEIYDEMMDWKVV